MVVIYSFNIQWKPPTTYKHSYLLLGCQHLARHLTVLCDWRQTAAVVACDVASVLHVTSFVSLSYVVFGMLIIASRWISLL